VYEDENGYVLVDYLFNIQKVALHLHFNDGAWSVEKYKRYRTIFEKILDGLREKCYTEVYALPFENNIKAQKLIAMFGFSEYDRKRGLILMKRKV
jgi:hypothetical protein